MSGPVVGFSADPRDTDHLVVLLHGFGADENDLLPLSSHLPPGTVIASVQAPLALPWGGRAWYPIQADETGIVDDPSMGAAAAERAAEILAWVADQPARRLTIGGFSQGSSVALAAMAQRPELADWVVFSGFAVPTGTEPEQTVRPRVFWGRDLNDPVIPERWVDSTRAWLAPRADLTERNYPGLGHSIDQRVLTDLREFLDDGEQRP